MDIKKFSDFESKLNKDIKMNLQQLEELYLKIKD